MRPLRHFAIILAAILGIGQAFAQSKDDVRLSITKDVMDEIGHGRLESVVNRFTPRLKESFGQDQLTSTMEKLTALTGGFQKQLLQETRSVEGAPIYVSRSQFEKFKVEMGLGFDDSNQIDHLWIAPVSDLTPEDMEGSAKTITNLLGQERFDELSPQFDEKLKSMMSADHLDESWSHVIHHLGKFKSIKLVQKNPEFDLVDVRCEFEHGEIIVRVAFDLYGKVEFIWMLPLDEVEAPLGTAELILPSRNLTR